MASLKELNTKIASLKNTQKMTKTMKLVAASKMRRAQQAQANGRDFDTRLQALLARVSAAQAAAHPLLTPRQPVRRALILLVVSDRGLCAGFNNNLCRRVGRWLDDEGAAYDRVDMSFCGRRGHAFFRHRLTVREVYDGSTEQPDWAVAAPIADALMEAFLSGEYDSVLIAFNRFQSVLTQEPMLQQILPVPPPQANTTAADGPPVDYLFEPHRAELLDRLLPDAVRYQVLYVLLENAAGEHAARMTAMDSATRNAGDMIRANTLQRNRERQAAITKELIEIVTGAESL